MVLDLASQQSGLDRFCLRVTTLAARSWVWWATVAAMAAVLMVPLLLVDVPPLADYPNHIARMWVLAFGASDPFVSRMYAQHWSIIPNVAMDLVIPPLLTVLPLNVAGRIAVAIAILLPMAGSLALNRAIFRERAYWPILSGFVTYNVALRLGFLNFLWAVGVALLGAAAWVAWREPKPARALLVTSATAIAAFFCHIMGVAFLALMLVQFEGCAVSAQTTGAAAARKLIRRFLILALVFAAPFALYILSPFADAGGAVVWQPLVSKMVGALGSFLCVNLAFDALAATACLLFVYVCLRSGRGESPWWVGVAAIMLVICYGVAPFGLKGSSFFATRFAIMLGFLLFAGVRTVAIPPRLAVLACVMFIGLFSARMVSISTVFWEHNDDIAQIRKVIAPVEPSSRVLVFVVPFSEAPDYWVKSPAGRFIPFTISAEANEAALLLTERRAFWPQLFASPDQQPLTVLPPYSELASPRGYMPMRAMLAGPVEAPATAFQVPRDWQRKFDYVLLLDAGGEPDLAGWAAGRMDLVAATDAAALFRVRRPATN
jgi:hypothetical protein